MSKDEPWDMGHKPGYEFRKHRPSAQKRGERKYATKKIYFSNSS